jgi:hypothetical protein
MVLTPRETQNTTNADFLHSPSTFLVVRAGTELPSGTTGAPMTYTHRGRQYIVVPIGAKDHPAEFVALAIAETRPTTNGAR